MSIETQINSIQTQIIRSAQQCARDPKTVLLLAVSKGQSVASIKKAYDAGIHHFGESYLQEALEKKTLLCDLGIHWHFIGPIQSNKTKDLATHFDCIHGVDREKIAIQLNTFRGNQRPPLDVFIQVNIDDETTKSGVSLSNTLELVKKTRDLPNLHLLGLMAIPKQSLNKTEQFNSFTRLHQLQEQINATLAIHLDQLSMGMSDDFESAILAGSTLIRIGRGIFRIQA